MIVKLLIEHHLEFLSLKGGCRGSSESTHVKMPHCWKSHAAAQIKVNEGLATYDFSAAPYDITFPCLFQTIGFSQNFAF